jgi:hypothetical protein
MPRWAGPQPRPSSCWDTPLLRSLPADTCGPRAGDPRACVHSPACHAAALSPLPLLQGWTALHITAAKGYDAMTRELLARGADPNIADKEGHTALHLAAGAGHLQVVTDLLRRRADPGIRDKVRCVCVQMCVCVDVCV